MPIGPLVTRTAAASAIRDLLETERSLRALAEEGNRDLQAALQLAAYTFAGAAYEAEVRQDRRILDRWSPDDWMAFFQRVAPEGVEWPSGSTRAFPTTWVGKQAGLPACLLHHVERVTGVLAPVHVGAGRPVMEDLAGAIVPDMGDNLVVKLVDAIKSGEAEALVQAESLFGADDRTTASPVGSPTRTSLPLLSWEEWMQRNGVTKEDLRPRRRSRRRTPPSGQLALGLGR